MIVVRSHTEEMSKTSFSDRIREAKEHVSKYGVFPGETRREAICSLARLTPVEEDLADTRGLLPPDPV